MKRQYLGDSKDSFKWDYHHFLVEALGYTDLKIAWMMTHEAMGQMEGQPRSYFPRDRKSAFMSSITYYSKS